MKLVEVRDGNADFNNCYLEVLLLGMVVGSYGGSRADAEVWAARYAKQVEERALVALKELGYEETLP